MKNLFDYVDNKLLDGANKLVQGYNRVTGGTKRELADKVIMVSTIFGASGFVGIANFYEDYLLKSYYLGCSLTTILWGHELQKVNKKQEEYEEKEQKNNTRLIQVEQINNLRKDFGPVMNSLGAIEIALATVSYCPEGNLGAGICMLGFSLNDYIMRAKNLPPRKKFLSRAKDKVKKYFEDRKKSPSRNPAPQPAFVSE